VSKVLIVDDDPESRRLWRFRPPVIPSAESASANGRIGVELAMLHRPAAIVLDVEMPLCDASGCSSIRAALGHAAPLLIGTSQRSQAGRGSQLGLSIMV
jgi:DNA-binding response OmpR family regulator